MKSRMLHLAFLFVAVFNFSLCQSSFSIRILNGHATVKTYGSQKYVEVGWQTTLERGFTYYILQRSLPGFTPAMSADTTHWIDIARMDTISTTDTIKTYVFIDYPPLAADYGYRTKIFISDSSRLYSTFATVPAWALTDVSTMTRLTPFTYESVSNYPNPFNPSTRISISLLSTGHVLLEVYDLLGKKIDTIVDRFLTQGTHQFLWDASKYPSGVYLCALRSEHGIKVTKLLLQR